MTLDKPLVKAGNSAFKRINSSEKTRFAYNGGQLLNTNTNGWVVTSGSSSVTNATLIGSVTDTYFTQADGTAQTSATDGLVTATTYIHRYTSAPIGSLGTTDRLLAYNLGKLQIMPESGGVVDTLLDDLISEVYTNSYVGDWYVGTSAPADGDTWTSRYTLTDTHGVAQTTLYYMWQKTAMVTPPGSAAYAVTANPSTPKFTFRPEGSNTWIIGRMMNDRIAYNQINGGPGQIAMNTTGTAPATGTWKSIGSFVDTRRISNPDLLAYDKTFTRTSTRTSTRTILGTRSTYYSQPNYYPGPATIPANFLGNYLGNFLGNYIGTYLGRGISSTDITIQTTYFFLRTA